jgi:hypothetical protein
MRIAGVVFAVGTIALAGVTPVAVRAASGTAASPAAAASRAPRKAVSQALRPAGAGPGRPLPRPLFGVTVAGAVRLSPLVNSVRHLGKMPTTRIYFDTGRPASSYLAVVRALRPVSYLMGELLDSSDESRISVAEYRERVKTYLSLFGRNIDIWEIGNEVNGNWVGRYPTVRDKLADAYKEVSAAGGRTALTLYYNVGCHDGAGELSPLAFSRKYVPRVVRLGLGYVFLSYYEDDCDGRRPPTATWTAYFRKLHTLYPHALLGFGEIGMNAPVTRKTMSAAEVLLRHYYGLPLRLSYYVGGYFWWYYAQDCVPWRNKPLCPDLQSGLRAESAALRRSLAPQLRS